MRFRLGIGMPGIALAALAVSFCPFAHGAALAVVADDVKPEWAEWLNRHRIPEHIEEWAPKVCRLISGSDSYVSRETFYLHVVPDEEVTQDTAIAFAGGSHIWVSAPWVREREESGCMRDVMGAYVHELTHAVQGTVGGRWGREIDLGGTIEVYPPGGGPVTESLTEGLADWTRRFFFADVEEQEQRRFDLLNRDLAFTDYGQGPDFLDYLNRRFGPDIVPRILRYCSRGRGDRLNRMWPALTGRSYRQLLADWRSEERIDDPVLRWSSSVGSAREGGASGAPGLSLSSGEHLECWHPWRFEDGGDGGARLVESGFARLRHGIESGDWTLAMRAEISLDRADRSPRAIFAVGNVENRGEKELVFVTAPGRGIAAAMAVNDGDQHFVSSRIVVGPDAVSAGCFTLVATMHGGTNLAVRVNGLHAADVPKSALDCRGAKFGVGLQVGGMFGQVYGGTGLSRSGVVSASSRDSVRFTDLRFFRRALKPSETAKYESQY